jgi:hypothetical protein
MFTKRRASMQVDEPFANHGHSNTHLSLAQELYPDALSAMFAFLSWTDLISAARTCTGWLSSSGKGPMRNKTVYPRTEGDVQGLLASPLRSHVSCLDLVAVDHEPTALTISELVLRLPALTNLTHRECVNVDGKRKVMVPVYSPRLQYLDVRWALNCQNEPSMLERLVATAPNLTKLDLGGIPKDDGRWAGLLFNCLTQLPRLTQLTTAGGHVSPEKMAVVARLPELTSITGYGHNWSVEDLEMLAQGVCKLQSFSFISTYVTLPMIDVLIRMPALTSLTLYDCDPQVMSHLRHFPHLTDLQLDTWCVGATASITQELLRAALTGCTQLRKLRICQGGSSGLITSNMLIALDAAPVLLAELNLDSVKLRSCEFLKFVPRLTTLRLRASAGLEPPTSSSLLQALCQHVPLLTSLECSAGIFSSDARYMLERFGHKAFLPKLMRLTLTHY